MKNSQNNPNEQNRKRKMSEVDPELPRDAGGNLNYDVLGKIITAKLMGEVVCASHVDKKHDDVKFVPSFKADTDWDASARIKHEICLRSGKKVIVGGETRHCRCSHESNNVVVLRKKTQRTCFMGRGVIDAPLKVVADFIKDIQSHFTYDELLVDARCEKMIKETENERDYIGYQHFVSNQYCGMIKLQRDVLYFARWTYVDGKYVHSGVSIDDPDCPPHPDIPRMFMHMGSGFVAESYDKEPQKTLLSYLAHIDTKGIPSIVNNQMLKKHPMAIAKIRARLEQSHGPHLPSESLASASASFSTTLPQQHSRYFEDAVPTKDFIQGFRTLSQKSCSK